MSRASINLHIVSGSGPLFEGEAKSVGLTTTSGRITILPDHSALITTIANGSIDVELPDGTTRAFGAESGVADISPEKTIILVHTEILDPHHAE